MTEPAINPEAATVADAAQQAQFRAALTVLQNHFFLIKLGGKIWVHDRSGADALGRLGTAQKLVFYNRGDASLLMSRTLRKALAFTDASKIVKSFFTHPETVCYDGLEFNPAGTTRNYLNLWVGPTVIAKGGRWVLIAEFLLMIICSGDDGNYQYLIHFIAHALQHPGEKPGILIAMLGGQGTGKGTVGKILRKTWSATYLQVHNIDAVTGNFNAALERAFIVFMDEALFVGDRRASDALKSLVTEPVIHINEKHQPARQTRSYHRFFAATNAEHFKHTERDDRRDFILRVSESRKDDHAYWQALNHEIDNDGVEAFVHDLLAMDLSGFNVRAKPNTTALLEQKLHSLEPIPRWWHDHLSRDWTSKDDKWPNFISTEDVIDGVMDVVGSRLYRKPAAMDVWQAMAKLCPSASKKQQQEHGYKRRGLSLPPLMQARAEFEQYIGGAVAW